MNNVSFFCPCTVVHGQSDVGQSAAQEHRVIVRLGSSAVSWAESERSISDVKEARHYQVWPSTYRQGLFIQHFTLPFSSNQKGQLFIHMYVCTYSAVVVFLKLLWENCISVILYVLLQTLEPLPPPPVRNSIFEDDEKSKVSNFMIITFFQGFA